MAEVSSSKKKSVTSRIPRLQRSTSFHGVSLNREVKVSSEINDDETNEARDDFSSVSSVGSVKSCIGYSSAYRRAVATACDFRRDNLFPRYKLHCSTPTTGYGNTEEYLTPTQRANRTIRQLKTLLKESEASNCYKDFEIQRLTREIVDLRLKQARHSEKEVDNISTQLTTPSLADSGHYDELSGHASQLKESPKEKDAYADSLSSASSSVLEKNRVTKLSSKIEDLVLQHTSEMQEVRARFTDRLEMALTQLSEANSRYASLLNAYDQSKEDMKQAQNKQFNQQTRIDDLEKQNSILRIELEERETREYENQEKVLVQIQTLTEEVSKRNQMITVLESKLEELSLLLRSQNFDESSMSRDMRDDDASKKLEGVVSILNQQEEGNVSESRIESQSCAHDRKSQNFSNSSPDSSFILKFLRSAIFYFLTDNENGSEHLRAIQSILEFSPEERSAVERAGRQGYYL